MHSRNVRGFADASGIIHNIDGCRRNIKANANE